MAEAFRERLLNVLASLKPLPSTVPLAATVPDIPSIVQLPPPVVMPTSTFPISKNIQEKLSLEWLIIATLLVGLGIGIAVATLVWKK